jgi:putative transposase
LEANACKDHIHLLVSIPPKLSVAQFIGYLKGKSSLMIFDRHAELKYRYGNRKFWCKGYFVDTVGRNKAQITEYIRNQIQEDYVADQLTLFEEYDPFTGKKNKKK